MKYLNNSEKLYLKSYLNMKEADYVADLNLKYDMEYYDILSLKMLKNSSNLGFKIEDFSQPTKNKIIEYLSKSNNEYNNVHFKMSETVISIAKKYYNEDGTLKEKFK